MFLTLVEFSIVLLVKHRKDWKNKAVYSLSDQLKIKALIQKDRDFVLEKHAGKVSTTQESQVISNGTDDEPIRQNSHHGYKIFDEIDALPLTTKIDFTAFLLFNICYILVNLVYWLYCTFD